MSKQDRGIMNNSDQIHFEIVGRSPIIFKIKRVAIKAFSVWKGHVQKQYPNYPFKADTEILTKDMQYSLSSALESLLEKENENSRSNIYGWSNGFIQGRICIAQRQTEPTLSVHTN